MATIGFRMSVCLSVFNVIIFIYIYRDLSLSVHVCNMHMSVNMPDVPV